MRKFGKGVFPFFAAVAVIAVGSAGSLWAGTTPTFLPIPNTVSVPEIDPSSAMAAMALLAGAIAVVRGWRPR